MLQPPWRLALADDEQPPPLPWRPFADDNPATMIADADAGAVVVVVAGAVAVADFGPDADGSPTRFRLRWQIAVDA